MPTIEIHIEDEVLATWMPINNMNGRTPPRVVKPGEKTLLTPAEEEAWESPRQHRLDKYWNGIFIQLGRPLTVQHGGSERVLEKLLVRDPGSRRSAPWEYSEDELVRNARLIEIVAMNGRNSRPMDVGSLPVRPTPAAFTSASAPPVAGRAFQPESWWLHGAFAGLPGGILLWPDRDLGCDIKIRRKHEKSIHSRYEFSLHSQDQFKVTAWVAGPGSGGPKWTVEQQSSSVDRIEALVRATAQGHGDPHAPPERP